MTDLTYKIVVFKVINDFNSDDCIDWAIELLQQGVETPNLLILASLSKPTNHFETITYLEKALDELDIEPLKGDYAFISYCYYYLKKITNSIDVKKNLTVIYQFCIDNDYEENIYDFYLLNWAWDDFEYGETYSEYWKTASKDNIESIVIKTASEWIAKNFDDIEIRR